RQKPYIAFTDSIRIASMLDLPRAFDAYQHTRHILSTYGKGRLPTQTPQLKWVALKIPRALHRFLRLHDGRHPSG
ncbi:MAG: hypothetical protein ABI076_04675, partial [Acidobacteriaceae bacterium]